jgi:DNA-binding beta-propeller fold protein YncE
MIRSGVMRNIASVLLLIALWFLPQDALAKAETVKITVSGGSLATTISVTDARILELSHAWGDSFLDTSRTPIDQSPQRPWWPYEVSFYSLIGENDVRKTCVLYYYPSNSTDPGFIYLPSIRSAGWEVNVGNAIRLGRDGKWNYASPTWDTLMKSMIARAESEEIQPRIGSSAPKTATESWTKPRSGWLYVLDPQPESSGSRIWLFDPRTAAVMGSIRIGYQPDIALSPDGSRLYIISGERESGEVAVVNTADGSVREISFPGRVLYTPWGQTLPPFNSIALSSDGKSLRILQQSSYPPERAEPQIWSFDTTKGSFSPTRVEIDDCRSGVLVPPSTASEFEVICSGSNTLHSMRSGTDSRLMSHVVTDLPGIQHCPVATGLSLKDNSKLALINLSGAIDTMDVATHEFRSTGVTGECAAPWVGYGLDWPRTPDGKTIYIGYGPPTPDGLATSQTFRVFDTDTWKQLGTVQTSIPFWSATMSVDGWFIYALAPKQHAIMEIDATTLQEKRKFSLGTTPALAVVAP